MLSELMVMDGNSGVDTVLMGKLTALDWVNKS